MSVNIKNPMFNLNYGELAIKILDICLHKDLIWILFVFFEEDIDSIDVDLFEMYVQKMHVDGDFGFVQLYEVSLILSEIK